MADAYERSRGRAALCRFPRFPPQLRQYHRLKCRTLARGTIAVSQPRRKYGKGENWTRMAEGCGKLPFTHRIRELRNYCCRCNNSFVPRKSKRTDLQGRGEILWKLIAPRVACWRWHFGGSRLHRSSKAWSILSQPLRH